MTSSDFCGRNERKMLMSLNCSLPTRPPRIYGRHDSGCHVNPISSAHLAPPTPLSAPLPTDPLHPIQTVGTGKGDVVVGGGANNKKWLIGVAVGLCVVLLAVVGFLIFHTNSSNLREDFAVYANYLLYGEDSDAELQAEYQGQDHVYYAVGQSYSISTDREDYFNQLLEKYHHFLQQSEKIDLSEELWAQITEYTTQLEAYVNYAVIDRPDQDGIIAYYLENGRDKTQETIEQLYGGLESSSDDTASTLGEHLLEESNYWLREAQAYETLGCLRDGQVDYVCVRDHADELTAQDGSINAIQHEIQLAANDLKEAVLAECWRIYELL